MPYFLRIASDPTTPAIPFDWKMAQEEVMRADLSNDPIQAAIARLERQVIIIISWGPGCNVLKCTINLKSYHIETQIISH